jgi:glycosyltransferase involved in cell wall biosynthesis
VRVALIAPFGLRPKGTTIARVLPIGKVLAAHGASVRVVIPPWDDPARARERWTEDGVEVVHTRLAPGPLKSAAILWDIGRELRAFGPDVVHAFKPIGYSGAVARRLAGTAARGGPLVVVDADDLEGPAGWSSRRGLRLGGRLRGAQERRTLQAAPYVTVASTWLADFVGSVGVPPERVLQLPNGHNVVASSEFRVPSSGFEVMAQLGTRNSQLVWYTRFTEAAPERAATLLAPVLHAHPELRLTVLGDELGTGDRARLEGALRSAGVGGQVAWVAYDAGSSGWGIDTKGWGEATVPTPNLQPPTPNPNVVAVYPMDDDAVNRARCPSKVPQLMALGIPIVAETVGEIPAYLAGFGRECLAAPGDDEGFRSRVEALLASRDKRRRLSKRLQRAADSWRWDRVAGDLLEWYEAGLRLTPSPSG